MYGFVSPASPVLLAVWALLSEWAVHLFVLSAIAALTALHCWVDHASGGMLWVQAYRRLQQLRFYVTTLRRDRVSLQEFWDALSAAYTACAFQRQLTPADMLQLALTAGFPPAAAARLAGAATLKQQQQQDGGGTAAAPSQRLTRSAAARQKAAQQQHQQQMALPPVGIPAWRFQNFMWWFQRHLDTFQLVRQEWDHASPLLVCGFDVTRQSAAALLFRRPKGTCLVRPGSEVGGLIVSLRPDKAHLPAAPGNSRGPESYYGSVSAAALAGSAHELDEQPWMPHQRKQHEGAVMHIFVPDRSLRTCGGLWGCLRRIRHTRLFLDTAAGAALPTAQVFERLCSGDGLDSQQTRELCQQAKQQQQQQDQQQREGALPHAAQCEDSAAAASRQQL